MGFVLLYIFCVTDTIIANKNCPNYLGNLHNTSDSSIPSLYCFSPFRFYLPSIHSLHSLDYVAQEVLPLTGDYKSICNRQLTTFILAGLYDLESSYHPLQLTSYAVIYHLSPDYHTSPMWCGNCLYKFY